MKGRGLVIGLLASLAVNLFLIGLGVGAWALGPRLMQPAPAVARGPGGRPLPLWALGRSLSPEYRPGFNAVLRKALLASAGDIRQAREIKRKAFDALAADTVDPGRISADLARARALELAGRARVERDMVAYAATLPAAERANLAEAMRAAMSRQITRRFQGQWDPPGASAPPPTGPAEP